MKVYVNANTERMFLDLESGEILSLSELRSEYEDLYTSGEIETDSFEEYLRNCLSKDGSLEEIQRYNSMDKFVKEFGLSRVFPKFEIDVRTKLSDTDSIKINFESLDKPIFNVFVQTVDLDPEYVMETLHDIGRKYGFHETFRSHSDWDVMLTFTVKYV